MATSIAIASGKGGVGKTSMSVNLSLTLAQMDQRTTLLDADFGMANAHILLGVKPDYFISDALKEMYLFLKHYARDRKDLSLHLVAVD